MQEHLGEHILWHLPVLGAVHADTVVTTWIVMGLALAFFGWVGASYRSAYQMKRQVIVEGVVNYIADLATSTLGERGEPFVPFFIALFVFIFLLNQFGMLPFKPLGLPFGGSPTADLNTTVPLAVMVWLATWLLFFRTHLSHLVQPFWFLFPINVIEELSRPLTLAARLFFNIFVGELLFIIIASIITQHITIGPLNLSLAAAVFPFFIQFFNFFVGTVQAFVFTLLAIVYFSLAMGDSH
ncbi:MAG TPA: F0F1 ATP synthase subunit A [Candidatus Baltobacteraceae bacterium]|nr:F0F1 ATP synthase subunit A [Candidatus Baltobacteraceae bacterium]